MNERMINFIKGLSNKDLKYLYDSYCDMAFTFYIDSEEEKYHRTINIINLIDETLRDKGIWVKKNEK